MLSKAVMIIPSYWSRDTGDDWQSSDAVYDHPTPLDQDGTLHLTLQSLTDLASRDYTVVILACATAADIEQQVEQRVIDIVKKVAPPVETYVISHSHLHALHAALEQVEQSSLVPVLSLRGYSNIRNMCLFVPYVMGAEVAVLIDDDEFFDDPQFMVKAREFAGKRFMGQTIDGIAGYYMNSKGTYYDDVPDEVHWMTYWDRFGSKREAFDQIIPGEPRLKLTPFAFGGCMVIHRSLMRSVPFDPRVPRGEDTDYLINARMFGFDFFLDNQLYVQHRPPPKTHPTWQRFREDIFRLLYDKAKIEGQTPQPYMTMISAEDFDPYPGEFLKDTLSDKILKTNLILALDYLTKERVDDAQETIRNIWLAQTRAIPRDNPFETYLSFQKQWRALRDLARSDLQGTFTDIISKGYIHYHEAERSKKQQRARFREGEQVLDISLLEDVPFFEGLTQEELELLHSVSRRELFLRDEVMLKEGSRQQKLYIILDGLARVIVAGDSDQSTELIELGKGEVLGEVSLIIDVTHSATVVAAERTEVITIERSNLLALMDRSPELASTLWQRLAHALAERLRSSNDRYLATHTVQDVADRLLDHK